VRTSYHDPAGTAPSSTDALTSHGTPLEGIRDEGGDHDRHSRVAVSLDS
jgi:hypothetical protein